MVILDSPAGPHGRGRVYTEAEWADLIARMSSPAVLDAALADPRIARLPYIARAPDPRAALAAAYGISVMISQPPRDGRPKAINVASMGVSSPMNVHQVADAIADAIKAHGPVEVTAVGRSTGVGYLPSYVPIPWYRDWRVLFLGLLTLAWTGLVLFSPDWKRPRSRDAARPAVRFRDPDDADASGG